MNRSANEAARPDSLRREIGVFGAVMLGLGSIIGTGVFVSIGVAAATAGPSVILAIVVAAGVATCNALSSAQLAATYPVSGGTYEYGYETLHPALGFTAGWMFLCAKSASAATAALGFSGYLLHATGWRDELPLTPLAVAATIVLTAVVASGMRRSNLANVLIVSIALLALVLFIAAGLPAVAKAGTRNFVPFFGAGAKAGGALGGFLEATALMFVAYTGYGRIATLGEEVREPRSTIPRAIVATLVVSALLYAAVGAVAVGAVGAGRLGAATDGQAAPLEIVARDLAVPGLAWAVAIGAVAAMLGVLLNLILGLSRVLLAMGRRGDMPRAVARLDRSRSTPWVAVITVGAIIVALATIGSVRLTWSFSAFTVLIYYAITNLCALRLRPEERLYSRGYAWVGLLSCLFLAFWVEWRVWLAGIGITALALGAHTFARRRRERS